MDQARKRTHRRVRLAGSLRSTTWCVITAEMRGTTTRNSTIELPRNAFIPAPPSDSRGQLAFEGHCARNKQSRDRDRRVPPPCLHGEQADEEGDGSAGAQRE